MARTRSIKPGFFKNELLGQLPLQDQLLFIGLWTLADREGKLEDRPLRIKAEVFPYREQDVEGSLCRLYQTGFIQRYQIAEDRFIFIPNFSRHQSPHKKEQPSTIPNPVKTGASTNLGSCMTNPINNQWDGQAPDKTGPSTELAAPSTRSSVVPSTLPPVSQDTVNASPDQESYETDFRAGLLARGFGNPKQDPGVEVMIKRTAAVCCQAGADPRLGAWVVVDLLSTQRCRGKPLEYLLGALRSQLNTNSRQNGHGLRKAAE